MRFPSFSLDEGHGTLTEDFIFKTDITGHVAAVAYAVLGADGVLSVRAGFHWDFASGPAIDTPPMVVASLAHDALYRMIKNGELPKKVRRKADKTFLRLMKEYGVGFIRRLYCYLGVRLFGWLHV